jgi:hypothetical protein
MREGMTVVQWKGDAGNGGNIKESDKTRDRDANRLLVQFALKVFMELEERPLCP